MATKQEPFEEWLCAKLLSLEPEIDTDVFVMYINGILDEDDTSEGKKESMAEILSEVFPENSTEICTEIYNKWEEINGAHKTSQQSDSQTLASQLSDMLENQKIETVKPKEISKEELERKAAILAQYSHVSEEEDDDDDPPSDPGGTSTTDNALLQKNVNAESVAAQEKEKREKARQEAEKKKEKDKMDREAQKQKQQERKDQEKKRTQKGERKR